MSCFLKHYFGLLGFSWWWIGRPGVVWFMGSQGVGHDWATELNWFRFVIAFLPRNKNLLISWLQPPSAVIWEPPKIKSDTVSIISPSIFHEVMELDTMILVFWMLKFKPAFSLSCFPYIKRLFSLFSLSAIRVVSTACLMLLIFLMAILIPACASFSLAFHMIYSAYKLNKQGDNMQPWCTPFSILNVCCSMFSFNCCFLTYIHVYQEAGKVLLVFPSL